MWELLKKCYGDKAQNNKKISLFLLFGITILFFIGCNQPLKKENSSHTPFTPIQARIVFHLLTPKKSTLYLNFSGTERSSTTRVSYELFCQSAMVSNEHDQEVFQYTKQQKLQDDGSTQIAHYYGLSPSLSKQEHSAIYQLLRIDESTAVAEDQSVFQEPLYLTVNPSKGIEELILGPATRNMLTRFSTQSIGGQLIKTLLQRAKYLPPLHHSEQKKRWNTEGEILEPVIAKHRQISLNIFHTDIEQSYKPHQATSFTQRIENNQWEMDWTTTEKNRLKSMKISGFITLIDSLLGNHRSSSYEFTIDLVLFNLT